jgi:hypothetical protein
MTRAALAIALVSLASCGGDHAKLHPVRGSVLFQEKPAEGATVVFHSVGGGTESPLPSGTVQADGSFALRTYPHGEGAPEGDYVVLITWYPPNARELDNAKNQLPNRYSSHTDSPLRVTVKKGKNELEPFRLTK